jgi:hypothetical protein
MEDATRNEIADRLDELADQQEWNPELWQRCYALVGAHHDNELLAYIHDDLVHYSGEFHSVNLLGFQTKPARYEMENYRQEFRGVASALRVIASDTKRLRFWSRLRRAPTPLRAHSQEPVGRPDSA